jgi:HK97 family phage portal protein
MFQAIRRMFDKEEKAAFLSADLLAAMRATGNSKSGTSVTYDSALMTSPTLACVRLIAQGIARMPCEVLQRTGEDAFGHPTIRRATDHPLWSVLHRRPNDWMTSFGWRQTAMFHTLLAGNGRSFVNRVNGQVVELIPLVPGTVSVDQLPDYSLVYDVSLASGETLRLGPESVFDLSSPSWNTYEGLPGVHQAREAIGLALATEETHSRFHSNGARPGGILTSKAVLNKETVDAIRDNWQQTQGGVENAMKTAVIGADLQWQSLAMTGVDSQHIETREFQIMEICRHFGVFPQMIGAGNATPTFASAQQFFLHHVIHTLGPWVEEFEQSAELQLLTRQDVENGYYIKLNVNSLLRGSMKERAEFYKMMSDMGVLSINDIRMFEDWNPVEDGNDYRVPMNTAPAGEEGNGQSEAEAEVEDDDSGDDGE